MMVQKIRKKYKTAREKAVTYLTVINVMNGGQLRKMEIELLAHIATGGTISDFIRVSKSSQASVGNMRSRLARSGWLVKQDDFLRVNPAVELNFEDKISLQISLEDG
jgi:hypothetical protein